MQPAEDLGVRAQVEAEVEEREQVAVADVEEEVRGPRVVAVLDQLGQREPEQVLVEADRALHVAADEGGVVPGRSPRALGGRSQVRVADARPLGLDGAQVGGGHDVMIGDDPADKAGAVRRQALLFATRGRRSTTIERPVTGNSTPGSSVVASSNTDTIPIWSSLVELHQPALAVHVTGDHEVHRLV